MPAVIVLLPLVLGILIKYLRCYWLISGYNTATAEHKKNIDVIGLSKFMGNCLFIISAVFLVGSILYFYKIYIGLGVAIAITFIIICYMLIGSQKYDGNNYNSNGKIKLRLILIVGSIIIVVVAVGGLILYGNQEPTINVDSQNIVIGGAYGTTISLSSITNVYTLDYFPRIITKTNGLGFGSIHKGSYRLEGLGTSSLYISSSKSPFLYIEQGSYTIIINFSDSKKTYDLFTTIKTNWGK